MARAKKENGGIKGGTKSSTKGSMNLVSRLLSLADFFSPFASVGVRLWIANIFWQSGILKLSSWDSTLMIFEHEHAIPYIPVEFSAMASTLLEVSTPVLLVIGLASRIAAIPLLIITAAIEFTYQTDPEHLVWALFLSIILLQGPGRFSWDYFIRRANLKTCTHSAGGFSTVTSVLAVAALSIFAGYEIIISLAPIITD